MAPFFMYQYSFNISNSQSYKCANYFNVLKSRYLNILILDICSASGSQKLYLNIMIPFFNLNVFIFINLIFSLFLYYAVYTYLCFLCIFSFNFHYDPMNQAEFCRGGTDKKDPIKNLMRSHTQMWQGQDSHPGYQTFGSCALKHLSIFE